MTRIDAYTAVCSHKDAYGRQRLQKGSRLVSYGTLARIIIFLAFGWLGRPRQHEIKVLRGLAAAILGRPGASATLCSRSRATVPAWRVQRNRRRTKKQETMTARLKAELELAWNATSEAEALAEARASLQAPKANTYIDGLAEARDDRETLEATARTSCSSNALWRTSGAGRSEWA